MLHHVVAHVGSEHFLIELSPSEPRHRVRWHSMSEQSQRTESLLVEFGESRGESSDKGELNLRVRIQ